MAVSHAWLACSLLFAACESGPRSAASDDPVLYDSHNSERGHVFSGGHWRESYALEGRLIENRIDAFPEAFRGVLEVGMGGVDAIHMDGDSAQGRRLSEIRFPGSDLVIAPGSGPERLTLTYRGWVVVKKLAYPGDSLCPEGHSIFWASEEGRTHQDRSRCGTGLPAHEPYSAPKDSAVRFDTTRSFPLRGDTLFLGSAFLRFNYPDSEGHAVEAPSLAELKGAVEAGTEGFDSVLIIERRDFFIRK